MTPERRPVFGRDRDPVAAKEFRMPSTKERDAQWKRELQSWARKHPVCDCECIDCVDQGVHEKHPHVVDEPDQDAL